jgi:hypothetical protein
LEIADLGSGKAPKRYSSVLLSPQPGKVLFAVDPTRKEVAVVAPAGTVSIFRLAGDALLPGAFMAGTPDGMAWSNDGTLLALDSSEGVSVWRPGGIVITDKKAQEDNVLAWLPDDAAVLAVSSYQPAVPLAGYRVEPTGAARQIAPATPHVERVAWGPDARFYWYMRTGSSGAPVTPYTLMPAVASAV